MAHPSPIGANDSMKNPRLDDETAPAGRGGAAPGKMDPVVDMAKGESMSKPVRPRPQRLTGVTFQWQIGDEKCFVTVNSDANGPREVFVVGDRPGSDLFSMCEAMGMLISGMLKQGMATRFICEKLINIKATTTLNEGGYVHSIPDAIAKSILLVEGRFAAAGMDPAAFPDLAAPSR
jgi:hypothetical protein